MSDPGSNEEAPEYPSFGATCGSCKRPDVSNLTWEDGVKNFFANYFASPRMGPIGYIMNSPYSPLRVERQIPHKNWRDPFEDLLAIEAGRRMISEEDRKAEFAAVMKDRYEVANESIKILNRKVQETLIFESTVMKVRGDATKAGSVEDAKTLDEELVTLSAARESWIKDAQRYKADFESIKSLTASNIKSRGYWLASLTTSGALPGWFSLTEIGLEGEITTLSRHDAPPELDASVAMSEYELMQIFEQGQPHSFIVPTPLPRNGLKALADGSLNLESYDMAKGFLHKFIPSPTSILAQSTFTEPVKLADGTSRTKVIIRNQLVNGHVTSKEYVQDPVRVFEEMESARKYMEYLRHFLFPAPLTDPHGQIDNNVEHNLTRL